MSCAFSVMRKKTHQPGNIQMGMILMKKKSACREESFLQESSPGSITIHAVAEPTRKLREKNRDTGSSLGRDSLAQRRSGTPDRRLSRPVLG
jgi:hypothetical protein